MIDAEAFLTRKLRRRAEAEGDRVTLGFLDDGEVVSASASAAAIDARVDDVAALIVDTVAAGERLLLLFPPGLDFVVAFLACLRADRVAIPAIPPDPHKPARSLSRLAQLVDDARPAAVLSTTAVDPFRGTITASVPALEALPWIDVRLAPRAGRSIDDPRSDGLAFLQYTSGSTGAPKGVQIRRANLTHNLQLIHGVAPFRPEASVSWLPPFHDMGLIEGILLPLDGGWPAWIMPPWAFLERPIRWLQAIARFGATRSGGPNFAFDLAVRKIDGRAREALDLSCWRQAYCGAEPIRASSLEAFAAAFAVSRFSADAWFPCYGLAEHTVLASCRTKAPFTVDHLDAAALSRGEARPALGEARAIDVVCVGEIPAPVTLRVVDPETRRVLPEAQIGEIWLQSGSVADGYRGDPEASAPVFGAYLADAAPPGPFLRTGDLGYRRGDRLFIVGRQNDLLIVHGENHHPHDLERTAEGAHPAIRRGAVAAVAAADDGRPTLVCEVNGDEHAAVIAAVRHALSFEHGVFVDVVIVPRGALPKTSSGKLARRAAAALIPARDATSAREPDEGGAPGAAKRAIARITGLPLAEIDMSAAPSLLPLDSLQTADATAALAAIAGRAIPLEAWGHATSLRALLEGEPGAPPWIADLARPLPRFAPRRRASLVLVTGGTGFVGQAIVRELERRGRRVLALARGAQGSGAIVGDVSLPRLGLDEARYHALADELDVVVHAAGAVSWVLPYGALAGANVAGTAEVMALCARAGARLVHVSSQIVCHDGLAVEGAQIDDGDTALASRLPGLPLGYASSKAVAELSIDRARAHGLDATIVRPSLVVDADLARPDDVIALLLRACIEAGAAPDLDLPFSVCPRHHLARVLAELVDQGPPLVHVGDESRTLRELVAWLSLSGYDVPLVPWDAWIARVTSRGLAARPPLRGLWPFFEAGTLRRYERPRRAKVVVAPAHHPSEPIDPAFVDELLAGLRAGAWLPPPPRRGARATRASRALPEAPPWVVVDGARHRVARAAVGPALGGSGILGRLSAGFCDRPVGVYPAQLQLDDGRSLAVVLKAPATGAELRALCVGVARASSAALAEALERHGALLDVAFADRRERALYRGADPALTALQPRCFSLPGESEATPLVLERLREGAQVEKLDDVGTAWPLPSVQRAVTGLARLHAAYRGRLEILHDVPWARARAMDASALLPLWQALFEHARTKIDPRVAGEAAKGLDDLRWTEALSCVPATLLHNDVNPRNLALRCAGSAEEIVLYDWELAAPGPGVRDLAELLCFTLDPSAAADLAPALVVAHAGLATPGLDLDIVRAAFGSALRWLFFDRLTTYTVVSPVFALPWLDRVLTTWQRLIQAFPPR